MFVMGLVFLPYIVTLCAVVAKPLFHAARKVRKRTWETRNASSKCGRCNTTFDDLQDIHLFEGHYVCGPCAQALRRNVVLAFSGWGLLATTAIAGLVAVAFEAFVMHDHWTAAHMGIPALVAALAVPYISYRSMRRLVTNNEKALREGAQHAAIEAAL